MFNKITLKTKLIIPIFAITTILLLLGFMLITSKYAQIISLEQLNNKVTLSAKISDMIHSLQKERGLSSGYAVNYKGKFRKELISQRELTDMRKRDFYEYIQKIGSLEFKKLTKNIINELDEISKIRKKIDKQQLTSDEIIKKYTNINSSLLNILANIIKESFVPKVTQNLLAYSYMMYIKEFAGIERVVGINLLLEQQYDKDKYIRFTNALSIQKQNVEMFLKYSSEPILNYYKKTKENGVDEDVQEIRDIILYERRNKQNIDPKYWYNIMTSKINSYQSIINFIKNQTAYNIKQELQKIKNIFYIVSALTIMSLIVFIFMIIAFLRLAKEEQRLRVVMDKYIISSITDLKGKIIDVSEAFCNISGYKKHELLGKNHNIVRHPDMPKSAFRDLWNTISKGKAWKGKVKNLRKDGSFYWVYANIEPLYNSKGDIDAYISIRLDITESELLTQKVKEEEDKNKAAQQMMQQQSRLAQMGEMLSMIAHQWRQPLSAISASAAVLYIKASRDKLDKDTAIELSNKITDFSKHLSSTIDDFRDFFKSNKSKTKTNFEKIVKSVLDIVNISLEQKDIKLNINIVSLCDLETYENEVKQVILNLVKNAEDALIENSIQNAQIDIDINNNVLSIRDNAGGIPSDIMDKIFDPYFSTKTKKDGTGLGLYMSKTIIQEHCDGNLEVQNDEKGAKFTITLGENND